MLAVINDIKYQLNLNIANTNKINYWISQSKSKMFLANINM